MTAPELTVSVHTPSHFPGDHETLEEARAETWPYQAETLLMTWLQELLEPLVERILWRFLQKYGFRPIRVAAHLTLRKDRRMKTVTLTVGTKTALFPEGTVPAGWKFTITGPDGVSDSRVADATSATFPNLAPGAYEASVVRIAGDGADLGVPAVASFTIDSPATVTIDVADTITVTFEA